MINEETWKDIVGWEGYYQVSNLGRIRSLDRETHSRRCTRRIKGCMMKLRHDGDGYQIVHLRITSQGKNKLAKVHRLVAEAFLTKVDGKNQIDHINSIRDDNRVENLRYCSCKENNSFPLARKHNSIAVKKSYNKVPGLRALRSQTFLNTRICIKIRVYRGDSYIGQYPSIQKAAKDLGLLPSSIYGCLYRGTFSVDNYRFEKV